MDLFYHPHFQANDKQIAFNLEESRHMQKVMRKQIGDTILLTDGKGRMVLVEIIQLATKTVIGKVNEINNIPPLPYQLHLAVAPTKNMNRYEWFLEKATEIGVHQITPIICQHAERKQIKPTRLKKIITAAMKQSQQAYLPKLNQLTSFPDFIKQHPSALVAHCQEGIKSPLSKQIKPKGSSVILIGPEGDFSLSELELARQLNMKEVTLGKQRLRTETAAIVASHTVALRAQEY